MRVVEEYELKGQMERERERNQIIEIIAKSRRPIYTFEIKDLLDKIVVYENQFLIGKENNNSIETTEESMSDRTIRYLCSELTKEGILQHDGEHNSYLISDKAAEELRYFGGIFGTEALYQLTNSLPIETIHRWIALYVLNKLGVRIRKKTLEDLIVKTANFVPSYLKRMRNVDLSGADLSGADLSGANLSGANLSGADLTRTNLSHAVLVRSNLRSADLQGANLYGADLSGADLSNADVSSANLQLTKLQHMNAQEAILFNTNLSGSNLSCATFSDSIFSGSDLSGANLSVADLSGCLLSGSELSNAIFYGTDLSGSILLHVNLFGTDLYQGEKPNYNELAAKRLHVDVFNAIFEKPRRIEKEYDELCKFILEQKPEIRFVGICDTSTCEFDASYHNKNKKLLLAQKEKMMMLQISWKGSKMRDEFKPLIGNVIYAVEKYEKIKRITLPLKKKSSMLFITTEADVDPEHVISSIPKKFIKSGQDYTVADERNSEDFIMSVESDLLQYELCKHIVDLDSKIRTASICDSNGKLKSRHLRTGVKPLLSASENSRSILQHSKRWKFRKKFVDKIGKGEYAFVVYQKIKRITIPLANDDLLLVTTEPEAIPEEIINKVQQLIMSDFKNINIF